MQKLKKKPLLSRLQNTIEKHLAFADNWLNALSPLQASLRAIALMLSLILLSFFLSGCGQKNIKPEQVHLQLSLPSRYVVPDFSGTTQRDLGFYVLQLQDSLGDCSATVEYIRNSLGPAP